MHVRAGDRLERRCHLQLVDSAVRIHHDQMNAVAGAAVARGHGVYIIAREDALLGARQDETLQTLGERLGLVLGQARKHVIKGASYAPEDFRGMRNPVCAAAVLARARDDIVQEIVRHLAGEALALEVERRDAGTIGVRARGLQQRKVVFDLVVGGERARDAAR